MSTVSVSQLVQAPVDQVWRLFADLSQRCGWLSTVEAVEIVSGGDLAAGTVWRETRVISGEPFVEEFHVLSTDPPRSCVLSSPGIGADYRMTFSFDPVRRPAGATCVTVHQEGVPSGAAGRLLAAFFGGLAAQSGERALRHDLADLARAASRPAPAAS